MDASTIEIVDAFQPPLRAPNVEHRMPLAPADAARRWAGDRLVASGSSGHRVVFTIENAAVTETSISRQGGLRGALTVEQSERYDAVIAVRLELVDIGGRRLATAQANAQRTRTVPENITLAGREKVWFAITEALMRDLNSELDRSIRQFMGPYLR